jgi:hypothetical protein
MTLDGATLPPLRDQMPAGSSRRSHTRGQQGLGHFLAPRLVRVFCAVRFVRTR